MAITSYNSMTGEVADEEPGQALEYENIFGNNWKKNIYGIIYSFLSKPQIIRKEIKTIFLGYPFSAINVRP